MGRHRKLRKRTVKTGVVAVCVVAASIVATPVGNAQVFAVQGVGNDSRTTVLDAARNLTGQTPVQVGGAAHSGVGLPGFVFGDSETMDASNARQAAAIVAAVSASDDAVDMIVGHSQGGIAATLAQAQGLPTGKKVVIYDLGSQGQFGPAGLGLPGAYGPGQYVPGPADSPVHVYRVCVLGDQTCTGASAKSWSGWMMHLFVYRDLERDTVVYASWVDGNTTYEVRQLKDGQHPLGWVLRRMGLPVGASFDAFMNKVSPVYVPPAAAAHRVSQSPAVSSARQVVSTPVRSSAARNSASDDEQEQAVSDDSSPGAVSASVEYSSSQETSEPVGSSNSLKSSDTPEDEKSPEPVDASHDDTSSPVTEAKDADSVDSATTPGATASDSSMSSGDESSSTGGSSAN